MTAQKICEGCDVPVEATSAKLSYEKHNMRILCIECRRKTDAGEPLPNDIEESAPSAPPGEPAQQTHNVGDGSGDDVPVVEHPESKDAVADIGHEIVPQSTPIDMNTIKKYICPAATDKEAFAFMQLCKARNLNPFTKEAYLLKYGQGAATMVVGKDAFTRRAEDNQQFDGFEAGIITEYEIEGKIHVNEHEGTFIRSDEKLVGGWAKVYRKDHTYPVTARVSMKEYDTGKSSWAKMPATMIRKVALVQALRESFPSDLGGCYDSSEMGAEI